MKLLVSVVALCGLAVLTGCAPEAEQPTVTPRPIVAAPSPDADYPEPNPDYMVDVLAGLGPVPPSDVYTSEQAAAALVADADARWETVAHFFPDEPRPEHTVIREIEDDEYTEAMVPCLAARGISVTMRHGNRGFDVRGETAAVRVANYLCEVEYPVRPQPALTAAQLDYVYDYFVQFKQPCLEGLGYEVRGATPTKEFFVTNWPRQGWNPNAVDIGDEEMAAVELTCPNYPDGLR